MSEKGGGWGVAILIGAALIIWGRVSKQPDTPEVTYTYRVVDQRGAWGCKDESDMDRLAELSGVQKDHQAFRLLLAQLKYFDRCRDMPRGAELVMEADRRAWKGVYQVRLKGDPQSYWVSENQVDRTEHRVAKPTKDAQGSASQASK